jgi:magnesium-transporting ATPase (P-type)
MSTPPRRLSDRVIDREMWTGIVWVGVVMAAATLLALDLRLPGGVVDGSGDIVEARTMAFTTLVLAQLFNCFNARSDRTSAFHGMFTNAFLWGAIALSLVLQVAVVHVPFLNHAFDTTSLGVDDWLICIALASLVLWVDEAKKAFGRRAGGAEPVRPGLAPGGLSPDVGAERCPARIGSSARDPASRCRRSPARFASSYGVECRILVR